MHPEAGPDTPIAAIARIREKPWAGDDRAMKSKVFFHSFILM
jgi:hypothetical protein